LGVFYGAFGVIRLGVWLDIGLLFATLSLVLALASGTADVGMTLAMSNKA
jgi:hypothetical protein